MLHCLVLRLHFFTVILRNYVLYYNVTAITDIYPLSLHDALPISDHNRGPRGGPGMNHGAGTFCGFDGLDRKSTRLNSSHLVISYAVFCLKKKSSWNKVKY